jgi:CheY-like chemotaxis protein
MDNRLSVLLVDDDRIAQAAHQMLLKSLNCDVSVASDGYQALGMLHKNYDLILMDIEMPGISGIETTHLIRRHPSQPQSTPIVAVTTCAPAKIKTACQVAGFNKIVGKPMNLEQISSLIKKFINK